MSWEEVIKADLPTMHLSDLFAEIEKHRKIESEKGGYEDKKVADKLFEVGQLIIDILNIQDAAAAKRRVGPAATEA